jgi:hypothetical protein
MPLVLGATADSVSLWLSQSGKRVFVLFRINKTFVKNKSPASFEDKYYNEEFTIQLPSQKKITDIKWLAGAVSHQQ